MQAELRTRSRLATRVGAAVSVVAAAATLVAAASAADERPGAGEQLCELLPPADLVLGCRRPTPPPDPGPPDGRSSLGPARSEVSTLAGPRYVPDELLVRFWPGTTRARQDELIAQAEAVVERRLGRLGVVLVRTEPEGREAALRRLRSSRWVVSTERNALVGRLETTPNDDHWDSQWGLRQIGIPTAWERTHGSSDLVVAVLDTGVDAAHPDLAGAVRAGFNIGAGNRDTHDRDGHGTAVAGIIAARTNNHEGVAGICWACSILPVKVLGDDGRGSMDDLALGIVRAVDAGARVINMSLGGPVGSATLDQAIAYATAKNAVLVAAAGNDGTSVPFYPAANPEVISVAATDESDQLYSWSNFGGWARLAAPGCNPGPAPSGGYVMFCGTSSATPVVSGLIALALSLEPNAEVPAIVHAVTETAKPIGAVLARGRIDAAASLAALAGPRPAPAETRPTPWSIRGSLTRARPARLHQHAAGPGRTTMRLTSTRPASLSLAVVDSSGRTVGRVAGRLPLLLRAQLGRGTYAFALRGKVRAKVAYKLTVRPAGLRVAGV
jgi:subtilisin family serine protease